MRAEKTSEGYILKCPACEDLKNKEEEIYC
jgi:hypothetical protein